MTILEAAFEEGIRHFDVARAYGMGAAEAEVGRFLSSQRRESVTIATKFGLEISTIARSIARAQAPARALLSLYPSLRAPVRARAHLAQARQARRLFDPASAKASLERSLRELRTDYIDLFLVHDPPSRDAVAIEGLSAYLESARTAGYIRAWGVAGEASVCTALRDFASTPCIAQFRRNIFSRPRSSPQFGANPAVVFGVVSDAVDRIVRCMLLEPARAARWSTTVGGDCADPSFLAPLLVLDALEAGTRDVVLISTTSRTHLERLADVANSVHTTNLRAHLWQLRQLLALESARLSPSKQ